MNAETTQPPENQLQLSLDDLGKQVEARCKAINEQRGRTLLEAVKTCNLVLEQGRDLLVAKKKCKHGQWLDWLAQYFDRDERTAQRYMAAFVKNDKVSHLDPEQTSEQVCKQLFLAAELTPNPESEGSGEARLSIEQHFQKLNWLSEWITKEREHISDWETNRKQELKDRLKPIVDLYNAL